MPRAILPFLRGISAICLWAHPVSGQTLASIPGCYSVRLDAWKPQLVGADTIYTRPPARIELKADTGTYAFERGHRLVRPAPGLAPSVHRFSYWTTISPDTVKLAWSTGFSGLTMKLLAKGDSLVGEARTFWDYTRASENARAVLIKVPCR